MYSTLGLRRVSLSSRIRSEQGAGAEGARRRPGGPVILDRVLPGTHLWPGMAPFPYTMKPSLFTRALALVAAGTVLFYAGVATARRQGPSGGAPAGRGHASPIVAAGAAVFPLRTEVRFDTDGGATHSTLVGGTGTILFGRYVLTVAHAVTVDRLEVKVKTRRGEKTRPVEGRRLEETTWLVVDGEKIVLTPLARDTRIDLALFALPEGTSLPSLPCPIAGSDTLELGDSVALLSSDPVAGLMFRPASVTALRGSELVKSLTSNEHVFLVSLALTSGESGSPVVALGDRSCALVGLAQGTYIGPRQLAWAIRIDPALDALARQAGETPAEPPDGAAALPAGFFATPDRGSDPAGVAPPADPDLADFLEQSGHPPAR